MGLNMYAMGLVWGAVALAATPAPVKDGMYGVTWMGLKMELNQDNMNLSQNAGVFVVADGEGRGGEVASRFAADFVASFLGDPDSRKEPEHLEGNTLQYAVDFTSEEISKVRAMKPEYKDASCSLLILWLRDGRAWFVRVGEAQAYRLAAGKLEPVFDTYRAEFQDIRGQKKVKAEMKKMKTHAGEVYALATDGVYKVLSEKELGEILLPAIGGPLEPVTKRLEKAVDGKGSPDNFTLVLVRSQMVKD